MRLPRTQGTARPIIEPLRTTTWDYEPDSFTPLTQTERTGLRDAPQADDALRQNSVTLQNARVLRLPVLGLRIAPDEFFDQVEQALRAAGWSMTG